MPALPWRSRALSIWCAVLAAMVLACGCRKGEKDDANTAVFVKDLGRKAPPEALEENRRRILRMEEMKARDLGAADVPFLIQMLDPVPELLPRGVSAPEEGYSYRVARGFLAELGATAHQALFAEIREGSTRKREALGILVSQGAKDALDRFLELRDLDDRDLSLVGYYISYPGPTDVETGRRLESLRRFYRENRDRFVFDSVSHVYDLPEKLKELRDWSNWEIVP